LDDDVTSSGSTTTVTVLRGDAILPVLDELARLRIHVFRQWPYLYDGDWENEREYLEAFSASSSSVLVLARDNARETSPAVGVSTAMALADESDNIRSPFAAAGYDVSQWFYLAESVLLDEYRGQGLGHAFFDEREAAGRQAGFNQFTFCAVERAADDPRRPQGARSLEPFWRKRGYVPLPVTCQIDWKQVGNSVRTTQTLRFWAKRA
jgi:GNAT superfamily N-acetyltransferase